MTWRRARWPAAALLLMLAGGCGDIPLDPEVPAVEAAAPVIGPAAQLIVAVEEGDYHDPRSLSGFSVQVDGKVRGWIPGMTGTVQVQVAPGEHTVLVANPYRFIGIWMGVPVPESGVVRVVTKVPCEAEQTCRVVVTPLLLKDKGLVLRATTGQAD